MTHPFIDQPTEANTFRAIRATMDRLIETLDRVRESQSLPLLNKFDLVQLEKAFVVAEKYYSQMHESMRVREDGRLFIYHPLEVALYAVDRLQLVDPTVVAGILLHDTLEYTPLTITALRRLFGVTVASIALDLSQDSDLKNSICSLEECDVVQKIEAYLPSSFKLDVVPQQELANIAIKLEHYNRLLTRPTNKFSQLLKIVDNLQAYSSIFHVAKQKRKWRTQSELELFAQYVAQTAKIQHPPEKLLEDVAVVVNAWKQEGIGAECQNN